MSKATRDDLVRMIGGLDISWSLDIKQLEDDVPLIEQGMDSLDLMSLYFQLEEEYSVHISEESVDNNEWNTISDILNRINEND